MSKQDILDYFSDINYAYNETTRLDTLSRMLDELVEQPASPWHRVEEPPKEYGRYLVIMFTSGWRWEFKFAGYLHGKWVNTGGGDVRYWMPLPEPPKEDA